MKSVLQWLSVAGLAAAQSAMQTQTNPYQPSTFGPQPVELTLSTPESMIANRWYRYDIVPLTDAAYLRLPHNATDMGNINGSVVLNTPGNSRYVSGNYISGSMAFTSCNPEDYQGQVTMNETLSQAAAANVTAILLYTTASSFCDVTDITGFDGYTSLYSMYNSSDASELFRVVTTQSMNTANLYSSIAFNNHVNQQQQASSSYLGGSGTTAVAMIILYSITGVITVLFLVIIVTGAIRAHRHPERYGPRNIMGRPRQSRAKGIARAMLDTLPIVKFGEKAEGKDIEQQGINDASAQSTELANRAPANADGTHQTAEMSREPAVAVGTPGRPAELQGTSTASPNSSEHDATATPSATGGQNEEENQGCSICTDDFEMGQDIRVLPCNHQFHPACVDPWLLDVSGTCPLCRVDLNPAAEGAGDDLPPPLDDTPAPLSARDRRRAMLRGMMMRGSNGTDSHADGLQSSNREHRMAALRQWRQNRMSRTPEASQATTSASGSADAAAPEEQQEQSRGHSRLGALSRLVRRR